MRNSTGLPDSIALTAPGFVGRLTRWITDTAIRPQPALALGASLALVAALKAHRVRSVSNLRTNLLLAGIAPSGAGKNHPLECVKRFLTALGSESLLCGEPASDAGLLKSVFDGNGQRLLLWDELGQALRQLTKGHSTGFQKEILVLMTKLFSCAGSSYLGKSFSEGSNRESLIIQQPCLVCYGCSTPDRLYNSLSSGLVEDGFLARFLFIEVQDAEVPEREMSQADISIPESLLAEARTILSWPTNTAEPTGKLSDLLSINPRVMVPTAKAKEVFDDARAEFEYKKTQSSNENEMLRSVWARGLEHTIKVAMTVEVWPHEISHLTAGWAHTFVNYCLSLIAHTVVERVGDNDTERAAKKILRIIRDNPGIAHKELIQRTRSVDKNMRNLAIEDLLSSEVIAVEMLKTGQREAKTYVLT